MSASYEYKGEDFEVNDAAAWDYIRDGYLLSPRSVLKGQRKLLDYQLPEMKVRPVDWSPMLEQAIESAMDVREAECRPVMFSGGFDSMLMAWMARRLGAKVTAVTVQFEEFNIQTVMHAAEAAQALGLAHRVIPVKLVEFLAAVETVAGVTQEPLMDLDLAVVYAALKKYDPKLAGHRFISGMGSDQWFGNLALEPKPGGVEARMDWALVEQESHQSVAKLFGCQMSFPFLSRSMLAIAQAIDEEPKKDKRVLRALPAASTFPHRGFKTEVQIPALVRHILIKTFGHRAWPSPVAPPLVGERANESLLRRIALGLWLEKARVRFSTPLPRR